MLPDDDMSETGSPNSAAGDGATDQDPSPAVEADAPLAGPETNPEPNEKKALERPAWFMTRINETTRAKYEADRRAVAAESRAAMLERELQALRGEPSAPDDGAAEDGSQRPVSRPTINVMPSEEIDRRAEEKARQIAASQAFTEACNATNAAGERAHPDFAAARDSLTQAFGDKLADRLEFYETITALPNGHEVFYQLGKDLDRAASLLSLPRTKLIVELTRMADQVEQAGKQKPVSRAPPPLKTIDGAGRSPEPDPEKMSTKDWMRWREKQAQKAYEDRWTR